MDLAKMITKFFSEAKFHPNSKADQILSTICKEASPEYCEIRVIELAREMKQLREMNSTGFTSSTFESMYQDRARMAARLLALAVGKTVKDTEIKESGNGVSSPTGRSKAARGEEQVR